MNTQHTPGPWRADHNAEGDWEIHATTEQSEFSFWIATVHEEVPKEQAEANARLIAAAPELLEIVRQIAESKDYSELHMDEIGQQARAAIAKAI